MLDTQIINKIEQFVYSKPRSIQEIALFIDKNWRTADRYVDEIEKSFGTISTRVFRGGTKGALKIVFWASMEKISHSVFQEKLEQEIMRARRKEDFSAFDIYQHIDDKNKKAIIERVSSEEGTDVQQFIDLLSMTKKQLLMFSGNISFINIKTKKKSVMEVLESLVKKGVSIKILCRVDLVGKANIERVLSLNFKYGKELIEVRHHEHPLRAFVIDNEIIRIKEIKEPTGKINELDKKIFIFYTVKDREWASWFSKIFWKMFSNSIGADKRLTEINKLK